MPIDSNTWSIMQSWALHILPRVCNVLKFFVDARMCRCMIDEHHSSGLCYLSLSKVASIFQDKHCYLKLIELLVNVWASLSARRVVYVNLKPGAMEKQHKFKSRRGQMLIEWFSCTTQKSMDGNLAKLSDFKDPSSHWLWLSIDEVFWQGVHEREKILRQKEKEIRKQLRREKLKRTKRCHPQRVIGKYVKPPLEEEDDSN